MTEDKGNIRTEGLPAEQALADAETSPGRADAGYKEQELKEQEERLQKLEQQLLIREAEVKERESAIEVREKNEEAILQKKHAEKKASLEKELCAERAKALDDLNDWLVKERRTFEEGLTKRAAALNEREAALDQREDEVQTFRRQNEREQRRLRVKEEELEGWEEDIDSLVRQRMSDKIDHFRTEIESKDEALKNLRSRVGELISREQAIESFKVSIGNDPVIINNRIQNLNKTIEELKEELARRAPGEIQSERDVLRDECSSLKGMIRALEKSNRMLMQKNEELSGFEISNISLMSRNQELNSLVTELQGQNDSYRQRIERLSSVEARLSDRDQRIAQINKGYLTKLTGAGLPMELSEIEWLENICRQCDDFGIHFPQRIMYAFHTALKISDWSSITVLAGVSGTGKSELPKLYAAFGGLNFINVPVQPSWDSQESMLGFFNSIDNRFEPEPLLRFLVQCTENADYNKYMSIVLLDEMNLAHVEHYFADFLSKLETRRSAAKNHVPAVEVKLGAGVEPYLLKLERSVLWTGTMNQDETTKSLSDKVLDRGLVINFPRPRTLRSRKAMIILDKAVAASDRPMLTRSTWGRWIVREVKLEGDQLGELEMYRKIVEEINDKLEYVGRALGHRVWQSIEYYIVNYPTVAAQMNRLSDGEMSAALRESMKIAFEDQIVQKIMPKLRGIETRGRSGERLEEIEALLENKGFERLKDDFRIACEQGYGQFIWCSAKYIEADEAEKNESDR